MDNLYDVESHRADVIQCAMQEGKYAVNSAAQEIQGPRSPQVVTDRVVLKHYVTKSTGEFLQKLDRGSGMGNKKTMDFFRQVQASATHNCSDPEYGAIEHDNTA